jgi:gamma-glutamyltranspeptidase/glutathione hydrolase
VFFLAILPYATSHAQSEVTPPEFGGIAHAARYERFAVAADHPVASEAGAAMLAKGGNAVDAAVAASFTLSVVRPFSSGIGGGGFMVISLPDARGADGVRIERAINYREMAPSGATQDIYEQIGLERASVDGAMASAVPGTVAGLLYALETYGTLDRATVMEPAIRAAREGFATDEAYMGAALRLTERFVLNRHYQTRFAFVWERFLGSGAIALGDIVKNPEQAAVLGAIARDGASAFYEVKEGSLAERMIQEVNQDRLLSVKAGVRPVAWFTPADFTLPRVEDDAPLVVRFMGRRVLLMPPPSSGGVAIAQVMGLAERRELAKAWSEGENGATPARYAHLLAESFKFAFADRAAYLADARFVPVPLEMLLGAERLDDFAARINPGRAYGPDRYGDLLGIPDDGGTSHVSVIDGKGGAVACTETINTEFGSLFVVSGTGFCMNNQMDDFTTERGGVNAYGLRQSEKNMPAPGKRPLSSMSPTIVMGPSGGEGGGEGGEVEVVAGASGGPRIITATTQAIFNVLIRGMGAGEAVARKRMHHQWIPSVLEVERGFDEQESMRGLGTSIWLQKLRHEVVQTDRGAVVQMVVRSKDGVIEAASDPRKGGRPAGE